MNHLLSTREVSEILKMHVNSVMYHIKAGNIPAFRVGNQYRFDLEEVYKFKEKEREKCQ